MINFLKNIAASIVTYRLLKHLKDNVEAPGIHGQPLKMWFLLSLTDQLVQRSVLIKTHQIGDSSALTYGSLQSIQLEYQLRPGDVIVPAAQQEDTKVLVVNVMSNDSFDGVAIGSSEVVAFENKSGGYYVIQTNSCNVYML